MPTYGKDEGFGIFMMKNGFRDWFVCGYRPRHMMHGLNSCLQNHVYNVGLLVFITVRNGSFFSLVHNLEP